LPFNASNIAKSYYLQGTPEAKARQLVEDRLNLSLRRYGGQNARFRELNRYYLSLTPYILGNETDRPSNSKTSREPDLFVPRSFSIVEGATPMWVFGVLGGHPPIRVYGRKDEWNKKAKGLQQLVTYDFDRSRVLYKSLHVGKQLMKYGTGIAKIGYRYDSYDLKKQVNHSIPVGFKADGEVRWGSSRAEQKEEVIRYDGPWLEPWSVYNFHPDPYYQTIQEMRFVCARRWSDRTTLERENEMYQRFTGKPRYRNLDRIPRMKRTGLEEVYQMDNGDDLGEAMGWSSAFGIGAGYNRYTGSGSHDEADDLVEIIEYWDRDDRVIFLANGEVPILDSENPYEDKEIPFVSAQCHVLDGNFWGYSMLHPIQRSQEELNSLRNLNLRQAQLNILNVWGYDEGTGLAQIATDFDPGDVIPIPFFANGNPGLVPLFQGRPLPPEAYQYEDRIDHDIQTALAMPAYRSGMGDKAGTATQATLEEQRAQDRVRLQNLGGSLTYAAEIARFFISRRKQYIKDEGEIIRITGADGINFIEMTRNDIEGEYDFMPGGQHIHPGKDVLRQQLLQLIAVTASNPVLLELTDMPELWEETWKMFDMDNPERFLNPPAEKNPFANDPQLESRVLSHGEWIKVTPNENHEQHLQVHQQALQRAVGDGKDPKAIMAHIQQHQALLQQQQAMQGGGGGGGAPPQEMPGIKGYAGNTPNLENAVETQGGLEARTKGGASP
jgi:hypothetical protein